MLICSRMASRHSNSHSFKKDTIGTDVTTFGFLQIKRTIVHRFLTQRSIQLGSAQAVISAVKNATRKSLPSRTPTPLQRLLKNLV